MFRVVALIFLGLAASSAAHADEGDPIHFGWTLSASSTDPLVNTGPATADTLDLYLWMYCSHPSRGGVSTAKFSVQFHPLLQIHSLALSNGVTNAGTAWDLDLQLTGCPPGAHRVGHYRVQNIGGGYRVCLGPTPGTDENFTYGCDSPNDPGENAYIGYAVGLKTPCVEHLIFFENNCFPTVSVEVESWSGLKSRFSGAE